MTTARLLQSSSQRFFKQQLLLGKSTHAGFNGERVTNPPFTPGQSLNPGRQQHLAHAAPGLGVRSSGDSGRQPGKLLEPPWDSGITTSSELTTILLPHSPGAGIFQPFPHLHWAPLEFGKCISRGRILILAVASASCAHRKCSCREQRGASRCPRWHFEVIKST